MGKRAYTRRKMREGDVHNIENANENMQGYELLLLKGPLSKSSLHAFSYFMCSTTSVTQELLKLMSFSSC